MTFQQIITATIAELNARLDVLNAAMGESEDPAESLAMDTEAMGIAAELASRRRLVPPLSLTQRHP